MKEVADAFEIAGRFVSCEPIGSGHIHQTFSVRHESPAGRHVLQRINTAVFRDPVALMDNVVRVCAHLRGDLVRTGVPDGERRCLRVVPARSGGALWRDAEGHSWRCFVYQQGTHSVDLVTTPEQAREAARAFADFLCRLDGLEGPPLAETIDGFHDLDGRFANLEASVRADVCARAANSADDIARCSAAYRFWSGALSDAGFDGLPRRVVHNDCKINNVLLDARTGEGLCVIDLDTVMQGSVVADFGELVRTSTCRAPEDETDTESMSIDPALRDAVCVGFAERAGALMTASEREILPLAGPVMALENAVRFLTDHLDGDTYYRIGRPGHNLDRTRAQLRLVELLDRQCDAMRTRIRELC